ncbi:MAG: hypothetical protein VKJ02_18800 [Snowella sp.]|nr:hypothetical protein [Snowella sp.]
MNYWLKKLGSASFLACCLASTLSYNAYANSGSAIGGDGTGSNLDSSTFFGDFFNPDVNPLESGEFGISGQSTGLPPNWRCLRRAICSDCDLRLETLGAMLETNLSGTLIARVIQGAAPRFCCDPELADRARAHIETASLTKNTIAATTLPAIPLVSGNGGAALLEGIQVSLASSFSASATEPQTVLAQTSPSVSNSRISDFFPIEAAPPSSNAEDLKNQLLQALNFPPIDTTASDEVQVQQGKKLQTLDDLITTLQGLIWEESLSNNSWQRHIDVNQLAAAIKTYNELLRLLSPEELNAWRADRNAQDITAVLRKLREGVVTQ